MRTAETRLRRQGSKPKPSDTSVKVILTFSLGFCLTAWISRLAVVFDLHVEDASRGLPVDGFVADWAVDKKRPVGFDD